MNLWPIVITSKGRPECETATLMGAASYKIVLEREDEDAYRSIHPYVELCVLPESNCGLPYVRNFVLDKARSLQQEWLWILDDDLSAFYVSLDGKNKKIAAQEALLAAQEIITSVAGVAIGGLEYQQFSWSATKAYITNSYCDCAMAVNLPLTSSLRYREQLKLKSDRDFMLQVLASGYRTVRCCKIAFGSRENGSNRGGLQDIYRDGQEGHYVDALVQIWGAELCQKIRKKNGRIDAKINWRKFKA